MTTSEVKRSRKTVQAQKDSSELKRRWHRLIQIILSMPQSSVLESILAKRCTCIFQECPKTDLMWEKERDIWPKINTDPEELPHIDDLTTSSLHSSSFSSLGRMPLCLLHWQADSLPLHHLGSLIWRMMNKEELFLLHTILCLDRSPIYILKCQQ